MSPLLQPTVTISQVPFLLASTKNVTENVYRQRWAISQGGGGGVYQGVFELLSKSWTTDGWVDMTGQCQVEGECEREENVFEFI